MPATKDHENDGASGGTGWRIEARSRLDDLQRQVTAARLARALPADVAADLHGRLRRVRALVDGRSGLRAWFRGSDVEETWGTLHAVQRALVSTRSRAHLQSRLPRLREGAERWLGASSRAGTAAVAWCDAPPADDALLKEGFEDLLEQVHDASAQHHRWVRTVRNRLLLTSLGTLLAAAGLVVAQWRTGKALVPLLADPTVAPWVLLLLVMVFGVVGAFLTRLLPSITEPPSREPYQVPLQLALLKLAVAPLAAVLGLVLVAGGLADAADPSLAQTLALAAVFGAGAQLLTSALDDRARKVLSAQESAAA